MGDGEEGEKGEREETGGEYTKKGKRKEDIMKKMKGVGKGAKKK